MRLKSSLRTTTLALLTAWSCWAIPAWADLESTLKHVPQQPMGLFSLDIDSKTWADLSKNKPLSDLFKLFDHEIRDIKTELAKEANLDFDKDVLAMLGTHFISAFYEGPPKAELPNMLFSVDLRDKSKFMPLIEAIKKGATRDGIKVTEFKYQGFNGYTIAEVPKSDDTQKESQDPTDQTFYLMATDKTLLFSNNHKLLEKGIDATKGASVLTEKKFKPVYNALKNEKMFFYGDVNTLIERGLQQVDDVLDIEKKKEDTGSTGKPSYSPSSDFEDIWAELGNSIRAAFALYDSFGFGMDINLQGLVIKNAFVFKEQNLTPVQKAYIAKLTAKPAKSLAGLYESMPAQPLLAFASQGFDLNLEETATAVFDPNQKRTPKEKEAFLKVVKLIKEGITTYTGLDLQKDLVDHSDGRVGLAVFYVERYPTYKKIPHVVAYLGVKDAAKFRDVMLKKFRISESAFDDLQEMDLDHILEGKEKTAKPKSEQKDQVSLYFDPNPTEVYQDANIHVLTGVPGLSIMAKELGVWPAIAEVKGVWLLGSTPAALKAVVDIAKGRSDSLGAYPAFTQLHESMAASNPSSMWYFDLNRWYDMGSYLLQDNGDFKQVKPFLKAFKTLAIDSQSAKDHVSGQLRLAVDMPKLDFNPNDNAGSSNGSLKANMHTWQTLTETYGVDFGGTYPKDAQHLIQEAQKGHYWKSFQNPNNKRQGLATKSNQFKGSVMDYREYKSYKPQALFAGMVLYEPIWNPKEKAFWGYRIYGCDEKGQLLQQHGDNFVLTNQ